MLKNYKKLEIAFWIMSFITYLFGLSLFLFYRVKGMNFFSSLLLMVLLEIIVFIGIWLFLNVKFMKLCNTKTMELFETCMLLPYIEEMEAFLQSTQGLSNYRRSIVISLLAHAYRYYGDNVKAHTLYATMEIQKITDLQRFQIHVYETALYLDEGDVLQAKQHFQMVIDNPKKERYLQMKNMPTLATDIQRMQHHIAYLSKEQSATTFIEYLQKVPTSYPLQKILMMRRILGLLQNEGRSTEATQLQQELCQYRTDVTIIQENKDFGDGKQDV